MAISGDWILVSAPNDARGYPTGSVYAFVRSCSTWTRQQRFLGPDTDRDDQFGFSMKVDGDTVVIGAPGVDLDEGAPGEAPGEDGAAYVFVRSGMTWAGMKQA